MVLFYALRLILLIKFVLSSTFRRCTSCITYDAKFAPNTILCPKYHQISAFLHYYIKLIQVRYYKSADTKIHKSLVGYNISISWLNIRECTQSKIIKTELKKQIITFSLCEQQTSNRYINIETLGIKGVMS